MTQASESVRRLNPQLFRLQGNNGAFLKPDAPRTATEAARGIPVSDLEAKFAEIWELIQGPHLEHEVQFALPRKWRADFAHMPSRCLIEIEGITKQGGRHQRMDGFQKDGEKYLAAFLGGWTVIRLTSKQINRDTLLAVAGRIRRIEELKKGTE